MAIAHLSGYKLRQAQQGSGSTSNTLSPTSALQTQLHLLKCLEALASIGFTWELARRCWKTLDTFMEMENLKPRAGEMPEENNNSLMLGKRKREIEESQKRTWQSMGGRMESPARQGMRVSPTQQLSQLPQQQQQQTQPQPQLANRNSYPVNLSSPVQDLGSMLTPSPSLSGQFTPSYAQMAQPPPPLPPPGTSIGPSGWDDTGSGVPFTTAAEAGLGAFDPSLFSTKWMPEASQGVSAEWNNSWDDAWAQSFVNGLGGMF